MVYNIGDVRRRRWVGDRALGVRRDLHRVAEDAGHAADGDAAQPAQRIREPAPQDLQNEWQYPRQGKKEPHLLRRGVKLGEIVGQQRAAHVPGDVGQHHSAHKKLELIVEQRLLWLRLIHRGFVFHRPPFTRSSRLAATVGQWDAS